MGNTLLGLVDPTGIIGSVASAAGGQIGSRIVSTLQSQNLLDLADAAARPNAGVKGTLALNAARAAALFVEGLVNAVQANVLQDALLLQLLSSGIDFNFQEATITGDDVSFGALDVDTTIYATLGEDIEFQVMTSPQRFWSRRSYTYAKHDVVEDRPRLQWIANDLETIELTFRFHTSFCNPQTQYDALIDAADAHQAMRLVFGNGLDRGFYVILHIAEKFVAQASDGSLMMIEVAVQLQEYAVASAPAPTPAEPPIAVEPSQAGASVVSTTPPEPQASTQDFFLLSDPNSVFYVPPNNASNMPSTPGFLQ